MKRSDGERVRAEHVIKRLRGCLDGVEIALRDDMAPVGLEAGQAVSQTAVELAILLAKLDAYQRAELDALVGKPVEEYTREIREEWKREAVEARLDPATCKCPQIHPDPENCFRCLECGFAVQPGSSSVIISKES